MVENETFKALAFSPDGRRVALAGGAGMVYLWDLISQRIVARIAAHTDGCDYRTNSELWALGGIDWSSDGGLIVTSGASPFTLYDPATQRFTGPDDYTVKLWEVQEVN
jgi:WD40 repeat protein